MGYADPPALPDLAAVVDEAAEAAGRAPAAIRRIYNVFGQFGTGSGFLQGTPATGPSSSPELTLEVGMSSYVLGTDDPTTLRRCADRGRADDPGAGRGRAWPPGARVTAPEPVTDLPRRESFVVHRDARRRDPALGDAALGRVDPTDARPPGRCVVRRTARARPAPRRHPRPPPRRARPGAGRARPGPPRPPHRRCRPVGREHDDHAAEQLDPRRLLRVLLPGRHQPPHPRGRQRLPAPAARPSPDSRPCWTGSATSTT